MNARRPLQLGFVRIFPRDGGTLYWVAAACLRKGRVILLYVKIVKKEGNKEGRRRKKEEEGDNNRFLARLLTLSRRTLPVPLLKATH